MPMARFMPEFVAIIGYSFAWNGHAVSLDCFVDHYRKFNGPVFVVALEPERLRETLAERLHAAQVVGLTARWNLLSHVFLESMAGRRSGRTINDRCEELVDAGYSGAAFPCSACGTA
jgi:hypothetical protein